MTTDNVLAKVRKLLRLADSPNANEAALAAAKAQELIDQYELNAALLAVGDNGQDDPADLEAIEDFARKDAPLYREGVSQRWRWQLAATLMRANGCKGYQSNHAIQIIGRPSDVNTVRYLYGYLAAEVERLDARDGRGCGRTWRNNYRLGVVDTIAKKLHQQRQTFVQETRQAAQAAVTAGDSQALVRLDQALAKIDRRRTEAEQWAKTNLRLRSSGGSGSTYHPNARAQGRTAGESIAVNRARGALGGFKIGTGQS